MKNNYLLYPKIPRIYPDVSKSILTFAIWKANKQISYSRILVFSSPAWVGSACYGLVMTLAPVASSLINRFGKQKVAAAGSFICMISMISSSFVTSVHQLYGTFTFLFAFGCTLAYTPCMTISSDYFDKYLTQATGIMTAGTSTGTLVLSPIAQAIVSSYGWRNAFRFFGCTCLIGVFCAYMFKPLQLRPRSSVQRIKTSMARERMKDLQLWKNKVYIIWICSIFSVMFGYYIPYVHLVSKMVLTFEG